MNDPSVFATASRLRDALAPVADRMGLNTYTAVTYGAPTIMIAQPKGAHRTVASVRARFDGQAAVHAPHPAVRAAVVQALTEAGVHGQVIASPDDWVDNA